MKKFIITGMALAMLAIPAAASADVPRCEASVPTNTIIMTATFTAIQPAERVQPVEPALDARLHGHDQPGGQLVRWRWPSLRRRLNGSYDVQFRTSGTTDGHRLVQRRWHVTLHGDPSVDGVVYNLTDAPTGDMRLTAPITSPR